MKLTHTTQGTCARFIDIELDDDRIRSVKFVGGCTGNTRGVAALLEGMRVQEAVSRLKGIVCRNGTSCPDQLALALEGMTIRRAS